MHAGGHTDGGTAEWSGYRTLFRSRRIQSKATSITRTPPTNDAIAKFVSYPCDAAHIQWADDSTTNTKLIASSRTEPLDQSMLRTPVP